MTKKDKNEPRILQLNEQLRAFLLPEDQDVEMYAHRTVSKEIADKIVDEGFRFYESFYKTTDQIVNDIVYIRYWDSLRKYYGGFVVILGISNKVINEVTSKLSTKFEVQQGLSKILEEDKEEDIDDAAFVLPKQFIKGYVKREDGEIVFNPDYDPYYLPEYLDEQIEYLNQY